MKVKDFLSGFLIIALGAGVGGGIGILVATGASAKADQPGVLLCKIDGHTSAAFPALDGQYLYNGEWQLKLANGSTVRFVKSMLEACAYIPGLKIEAEAPEPTVPPTTAKEGNGTPKKQNG